jgi:hypothetical protein
MTYLDIVATVSNGDRPDHVSPQIWSRMRRVANNYKLMTIDPALLPTGLSALLALIRLPLERIQFLEEYGVLGPKLTEKRIREIGPDGPVRASVDVVIEYPSGSMQIGGVNRSH